MNPFFSGKYFCEFFHLTNTGNNFFIQSYWCWCRNFPGEPDQYHDCWCPGSLRRQVISSHGIDTFLFTRIWNICNMSVSRNNGKCTGLNKRYINALTHWGRVTHICVSKLTIIGSDDGLSPGRRQAITWTNAGILLIGPLGTNFNELSIGIQTCSFKKMHLKISSGKWRPFCLGLNVLMEEM